MSKLYPSNWHLVVLLPPQLSGHSRRALVTKYRKEYRHTVVMELSIDYSPTHPLRLEVE